MNLGDRVRDILKPGAAGSTSRPPSVPLPAVSNALRCADALEATLGGEWRPLDAGACFVVERRVLPDSACGRVLVGDVAAALRATGADAALLAHGAPARPPFVFFDLETTGLSGGAGTYAFLVGCGRFEADGSFVTRQYLMARYADERVMLQAVARELQDAGALVSFNGKSFDAPLIETRYLFHRLAWDGASLPHLDALHPARQFWGERLPRGAAMVAEAARPDAELSGRSRSSCSLSALETQVLGARRAGDISGFEIPARYFQFVRSGDARPLAAVLEHNRLDLVSLAGLTARLLHVVSAGPSDAADAQEALALGRVYARAGLDTRARDAFAAAVEMTNPCRRPTGPAAALRAVALQALALCERRARRFDAAAMRWRELLELPQCPHHLAREASEALAIHHEHRARDLAAARAFAVRTLRAGLGATRIEAAQRRLARIDRKLERERLWD